MREALNATRRHPERSCRHPERSRGISGFVPTALLIVLAALGCAENDGPSELEYFGDTAGAGGSACLQDVPTNGTAKLQGMTVELRCDGKITDVAAPTSTGLVWVPQLTLDLDINLMVCDHHIVFWIRNPQVGEAQLGGKSIEGVSTYTGLYSGELGSEPLTKNSSLEITSVDPTVTGTFSVGLADGAVFTNGHFEVTPTR